MGSSKPKAAPPSAEYQSYLDSYSKSSGRKLTEQEYYTKKYEDQQKAYVEKSRLQQEEFDKKLAEIQSQQSTALAAERTAQQERIQQIKTEQDIKLRDQMLADRLSAEEASIDYVNTQIERERSNAALFNIQYNITDEQKAQRVSDYFGSIWGSEGDTQLDALFTSVGKPQGFTDFNITRGSGATIKPRQEAEQKVVSVTTGQKRKQGTVLTPSENLGGNTTLLGG